MKKSNGIQITMWDVIAFVMFFFGLVWANGTPLFYRAGNTNLILLAGVMYVGFRIWESTRK